MATRQRLDKKVRWILALILVMVAALPILTVRSYVAKVTENKIATVYQSTDERLVAIDGRSMLIQPDQLGGMMSEWLKSQKASSLSFELSDRSFVTGSSVPSAMTVERIAQVVQLTHAHPSLMVHVLLPAHLASAAAQQLDEQRAAGFRNALTANGVSPSQVTMGVDQQDLPTTRTGQMAVLLSK